VGFRSSLGPHFEDPKTGKLREIDRVSEVALNGHIRFFAIVECKESPTAAWVIRERISYRRLTRLWGETRSQTIVDIVRADHAEEYGGEPRAAMDEAACVGMQVGIGAPLGW
jgi:hypothetical protein